MNTNFYINPDNSVYQQMTQLSVDHYANLEKELQSLSDADVAELANFKPYVEANNQLSMLVQAELLNLVKVRINGNPEVVNNVTQSVKQFKKEKDKEMSDFQDYIKNYSELSYKEYKQLKYAEK